MNNPRAKLIAVFAIVVIAFVIVLRSRREPAFETPTEVQLQKFLPAEARKVFENATTWTLFSLDPQPRDLKLSGFHDYKILGQMTVKDAPTRARLQKALYGAIANYSGDAASCFNPRHGLRATYKNQTVDLILCFSCGTSYSYIGGKRYDSFVAFNSRDASKVWNRVLESANVTLARKSISEQIFG